MNKKVITLIAQLKDDVLRGKSFDKAELLNLLTPFLPEELQLISKTFLAVKNGAEPGTLLPFTREKSQKIVENSSLILDVIKGLLNPQK